MKNIPTLYDVKEKCCGCTACFAICPTKAITMVEDTEGFDYPKIDEKLCIKCYKCLEVCPIKMKNNLKVCVITIIDYKNYGNRLQNYALNKILESLGVDVINGLKFFSKSDWILNKRKNGKRTLIYEQIPLKAIRFWNNFREKISQNNKKYKNRIEKLYKFTEKNMKTFPYLYVNNNEDLKNQILDHEIDYYIVGSDQVWNPNYEGHDFEFLDFADFKKKLSFSASFGVSKLPDICKERYAKYLQTFKNLSVREKTGKEIIYDLLEKSCHVSVDPTMLLSSNEWEKIINGDKIEKYSGEYIVTYFLGELPEKIKKIAIENKMKLYCLNDENDKELFGEGVETFLYLIKNAKYVLTDSFHAVVFSIIFNTNFYVFNRSQKGTVDMFTRLNSLLELFNLNDRIYNDRSVEKLCEIDKITWKRVNKILKEKRTEEIEYLSKILFEETKGEEYE